MVEVDMVSRFFVGFRYIAIMLSKIIKRSLRAVFSTSNITPTLSSSSLNLAERAGVTEIEASSTRQLSDLKQITQNERKHLAYYANDLKEELNDLIKINFESQQNQRTLIFESIPDGTNHFKLGELLVLGSAYSLWSLLLGFPSYLALGATLGAAGLGAALSCSNFLRRSNPQITQIYTTSDKQLEIHYLKPNGLFSKTQAFFTIYRGHFSTTSFSNPLSNYLRKSNNTSWVNIDGNLFWYNSNPQSLRVNNHHLL